ncbi:efflux RND transporter periplasmic adaptor subunit [Pseudophaeobacter sp.]|jgi:RND family efflux transporter MFP subunit|uniref:efflux RND transporter periplasmic adaptor subunit n=2 Tax=Pseudophaeobacter TaxID=1541822 RepID=UPI00220FE53F|nr:efflux RND transporter periplasmic adaptor subunit [uncultured Pseudophaeobacter sp.]UWS78797.1 efflux RND transporter periplasmic adaptor subunit [Phaeobacter sp. G2]
MPLLQKIAVALMPVLAGPALLVAGITAPAAVQAEEVLKPVKLMTTQSGTRLLERQFFGQVAAKQTVDLAFQVPGQVMRFPVAEGYIVPQGQLIAELDLEPFELNLEQARLQKEQADRTVSRLEQLKGTVSAVSIEDAQTQAGLAQVALRNAEYELRHATLNAPFEALVSTREVENFTTVAAGAPIVRLHDMSELHIEVDVPEVLFQRADRGDNVETIAIFPGSDESFPLQILEFTAEASNIGQTFRVTFSMQPPEGRQILPGASASVRVKVDTGEQGILVPSTAIVTTPEGDTGVMVFTPKGGETGEVTWVKVELVATQHGDFAISSGLQGGEEIVSTGGSALIDGQKVRRFSGFTN